MSTLRDAEFADEDETVDADFTLPAAGQDESSSDSEGEDGHAAKRVKIEAAPVMSKEAIDDLWASFNAPDQPIASTSSAPPAPARRKIIIQRNIKFAGLTQAERVEVWDDAPEALAYLAAGGKPLDSLMVPTEETAPASRDVAIERGTATLGQGYARTKLGKALAAPSASPSLSPAPESAPVASTSAPASSVAAPAPPPNGLRPGPKRRKGGLASMAAALSQPAAKVSTIEKSRLDWDRYVAANKLEEDLSTARKDGFVEKQDFLTRVEQRREGALDAARAAGGRRK